MATHKTARVVATEMLGADTRLLELVLAEPLGFVGGQYVIVDSGLVLDSGKAVKRAYSLLTADAVQRSFQLAVKRIPGGPCSGFVHELDVGADVRFSGPWGKFYPQNGARGPTLLLATDTGISAALGLLQSACFEPLLGRAVVIWLRAAPDYFLPEPFVRERVPTACGEFRIEGAPPVGHPERIPHARAVLADVLARAQIEQAFISGDGAVNYALLDELVRAGVTATRDNLESFFNMPRKST
jgi:ferredoxin-NADP reductase